MVSNLSDIRSDAFLVTTNEIRSVHLPLLTSDSIVWLTELFPQAIDEDDLRRYRHATRKMNTVLQSLWDCGIKTVLDELGFTQSPSSGQSSPGLAANSLSQAEFLLTDV